MTKNVLFKVVLTIFIGILLFVIFSQPVFGLKDISTIFNNAEDKSNASNKMQNILGATINIVQIVGTGLAIVMLIVLAIRFFWESPAGKAEFTKRFRVYILGAIIVFAASGLLEIVQSFATKNINGQVKSVKQP